METLDDVRAYLKQHEKDEDVIAYMAELNPDKPITDEQVLEFLDTDEGKQLIQPKIDSRVTEAIKTYKTGHFTQEVKAAVAAELVKINPTETPEQKRIRELEAEQKKMAEGWEYDKLQGQIKELAFKEGVKPEFMSGLAFNSLEEAALYVKRLKQEQEEVKKAAINEFLAKNSFEPGSGNGKDGIGRVDLSKLSEKEILQLEQEGKLNDILAS